MSTSSTYVCVAYGGSCAQCPPGHTMESLRKAIEVGCNAIYVEVRTTKDDELVAWPSLQRLVLNNPASLSDHTLDEWRDLTVEFGPPIASLDDVLALTAATRTGLFIDMRVPHQEAALVKKLQTSEVALEDIWVTSPLDSVRSIVRSLNRRISVAHRFQNETYAKLTPELLKGLDSEGVIWPANILNPTVVGILKKSGMAVYGGPVVLTQEMRRLRHECGVDGVITPHPDFFYSSGKGLQIEDDTQQAA